MKRADLEANVVQITQRPHAEGHGLVLSVDTMTDVLRGQLADMTTPLLDSWSETKRAPDVDLLLHANARDDG